MKCPISPLQSHSHVGELHRHADLVPCSNICISCTQRASEKTRIRPFQVVLIPLTIYFRRRGNGKQRPVRGRLNPCSDESAAFPPPTSGGPFRPSCHLGPESLPFQLFHLTMRADPFALQQNDRTFGRAFIQTSRLRSADAVAHLGSDVKLSLRHHSPRPRMEYSHSIAFVLKSVNLASQIDCHLPSIGSHTLVCQDSAAIQRCLAVQQQHWACVTACVVSTGVSLSICIWFPCLLLRQCDFAVGVRCSIQIG